MRQICHSNWIMVQVVVNVEFFFRTFCIVPCISTFSQWGMLKLVSRTCRNVRMNTTSWGVACRFILHRFARYWLGIYNFKISTMWICFYYFIGFLFHMDPFASSCQCTTCTWWFLFGNYSPWVLQLCSGNLYYWGLFQVVLLFITLEILLKLRATWLAEIPEHFWTPDYSLVFLCLYLVHWQLHL